MAQPNEIIIAERTYSRIASRFECEARGPVAIRGFEQPHEIWQVVGERPTQQMPSGPDGSNTATPFVGREAQLELLQVLWRKASGGSGGSGLVVGEAGIGKSRLVQHFVDTYATDAIKVQISASPFDANSPLRPFVHYLTQAAGITAADDHSAAIAKLEALLPQAPEAREKAKLLAVLLGHPDPSPEAATLSPEQLREQTIEAVVEHLIGLAGQRAGLHHS